MNDNYSTPEWIKEMFEGFWDPCPLDPNPKINGLLLDWKDKTFVNPPYSNTQEWVNKAIEENKKNKLIIMLLRMDTSTKWFRDLLENGANFWISWDRLHFKGRAPFPSILIILNKNET